MSAGRDIVTKTDIHTNGVPWRWFLSFLPTSASFDINEVPNGQWGFTKICDFPPCAGLREGLPIKKSLVPEELVQFFIGETLNGGCGRVRDVLGRYVTGTVLGGSYSNKLAHCQSLLSA